jgi:NAD(P)-dependent dehydrogenase (short-subunit alcohol dehydrogenase family)
MGRLTNKIACITGTSSGNGKGIAKVFIEAGAFVIGLSSSVAVHDGEKEFGSSYVGYQVEVSDKAAVDEVFSLVLQRFGRIDILVNNAGIARFSLFCDMEDAVRDRMFAVNVQGVWNCTKSVLPSMLERGYGRIVNISSVTGLYVADPGEVAYATTKAALIGFTKALAVETAAYDITVNAVCPGYILTNMVKHSARESNPQNPQSVIDKIASGIPKKRLGTPEEVGSLVLFLSSDEARYITGESIVIDGGNLLPETNAMGLRQ